MNERIRELALQATLHSKEGFYTYTQIDAEKFAELIVRMCADYADMAQDADCAYPGDYVAEGMGYGVEEGVTEWRAK